MVSQNQGTSQPTNQSINQSIINRRLRPFPSSSNPLPINIKQIRDRNERHAQKPQYGGSPIDAQIMEHGIRKERKAAREQTPKKRIRGDSTSRKSLERVDQVIQRSLENSEEAESHKHGADVGPDPVDMGRAGPGEDEEAGSEENRADHHGRETGFGDGAVVVCFEAGDVEPLVEEVEGGAK